MNNRMNNLTFLDKAFLRYSEILRDREVKSKIKTDATSDTFTDSIVKECIEAYEKEIRHNLHNPNGIIGITEEYNWFWYKTIIDKCLAVSDNFLLSYEKNLKSTNISIETIDKLINVAIENEQHQTYLLLVKYKHEKYATLAKQLTL